MRSVSDLGAGQGAEQTLEQTLEQAVEVLAGRSVAVLTGAGISTDSGIPDYRGDGSSRRTPMSIQQFLASEEARKRYWAGSHLGWRQFRAVRPNDGHRALTALEEAGIVVGIVTQNVDELHLKAGSRRVVDLHGTMHSVSCLRCGQTYDREAIAARLAADNPWLDATELRDLAPDGDVAIDGFDATVVPACEVCGGVLKPDVVFFGEFVPPLKHEAAAAIVREADALLVAGSSLVVNSGIRIVEQARRRRHPIVIVNRGETKGDRHAVVKIDAGTTETLGRLRGALLQN